MKRKTKLRIAKLEEKLSLYNQALDEYEDEWDKSQCEIRRLKHENANLSDSLRKATSKVNSLLVQVALCESTLREYAK